MNESQPLITNTLGLAIAPTVTLQRDSRVAPHLVSTAPRGIVLESLDAWRGFAALWVVLVHACLPTIASRYHDLATSAFYQFPLYGALAVPIFFVISGFCITNAAAVLVSRSGGARQYVRARLRRIYPPYAAMSIIALAAAAAAQFAVHRHLLKSSALALADPLHQGWAYYLSALTLTQVPLRQEPILAPFWSLSYEVAFYAIVLTAFVIAAYWRRVQLVWLLHGVTVISLALLIVSPALAIFPLNKWPEFGIGVVLFDALRRRHAIRPAIVGVIVCVGLLAVAVIHPQVAGLGRPSLLLEFGTCIAAALLIWLGHPHEKALLRLSPVRWLAIVGVFSYSLYLSHLFTVGVVLQLLKPFHLGEDSFALVFMLQVIVAVVVGYAFFRLCEARFISAKARRIHRDATEGKVLV